VSLLLRTTGDTLRNVSWKDERRIRVKDLGGGGSGEGDVEGGEVDGCAGLTTAAMHAGGRVTRVEAGRKGHQEQGLLAVRGSEDKRNRRAWVYAAWAPKVSGVP
jgi:hypothetical protein